MCPPPADRSSTALSATANTPVRLAPVILHNLLKFFIHHLRCSAQCREKSFCQHTKAKQHIFQQRTFVLNSSFTSIPSMTRADLMTYKGEEKSALRQWCVCVCVRACVCVCARTEASAQRKLWVAKEEGEEVERGDRMWRRQSWLGNELCGWKSEEEHHAIKPCVGGFL